MQQFDLSAIPRIWVGVEEALMMLYLWADAVLRKVAVGSVCSIVAWCLRATANSGIRHLAGCHFRSFRSDGCVDSIQNLM